MADLNQGLTGPELAEQASHQCAGFSPIELLCALVAKLRAPGGCPWDREQTHLSLRAAMIEEAYEAVAAIDAGDSDNLREELGDVLLQVVFHSHLATEQQRFDFDAVVRAIADKLVRRHPHVFGDAHCADAAAVLSHWEEIKRREKGAADPSVIEGVPRGLPALLRAQKLQKKAADAGFDWGTADPVFGKVYEELEELAATTGDPARMEDEFGDLLFAVVNLGRKLRLDAEIALARAAEKFASRVRQVERLASERQLALKKLNPEQLDELWEEAKRSQTGGDVRARA